MELPGNCEPIMTIGVAAKRLGVSESTLRLYEREGLLISSRTSTGRRLYSLNDLKVVDVIRTLIRKHGLNFAGIRALVSKLPCWSIKNCSEEERAVCSKFKEKGALTPCWRLGGTGCSATPEECKSCPVYAFIQENVFQSPQAE
ncbi:MAG: MerR family transcriptional regulator [Candidatus Eisenbacteria sp.]|nr:MerR family transcriptional regulator [Candidatus Eisenbacteria bacterium]